MALTLRRRLGLTGFKERSPGPLTRFKRHRPLAGARHRTLPPPPPAPASLPSPSCALGPNTTTTPPWPSPSSSSRAGAAMERGLLQRCAPLVPLKTPKPPLALARPPPAPGVSTRGRARDGPCRRPRRSGRGGVGPRRATERSWGVKSGAWALGEEERTRGGGGADSHRRCERVRASAGGVVVATWGLGKGRRGRSSFLLWSDRLLPPPSLVPRLVSTPSALNETLRATSRGGCSLFPGLCPTDLGGLASLQSRGQARRNRRRPLPLPARTPPARATRGRARGRGAPRRGPRGDRGPWLRPVSVLRPRRARRSEGPDRPIHLRPWAPPSQSLPSPSAAPAGPTRPGVGEPTSVGGLPSRLSERVCAWGGTREGGGGGGGRGGGGAGRVSGPLPDCL